MSISRHPAAARSWLAAILAAVVALTVGTVLPVLPAAAAGTLSISGHVYLGDTSRSATTADVVIDLYQQGAYSWTYSIPVDSSGNYTISGLEADRYNVLFRYRGAEQFGSRFLGGGGTQNYDEQLVLTTSVTGKDITLLPKAAITGVVSLGTQGNLASSNAGVSWAKGDGYGNWSWNSSNHVTTDSLGRYSLVLDPGIYKLRFQSTTNSYQSRWWSPTVDGYEETVELGTTTLTGYNMTLPAYGTVSGHVGLGSAGTSAGAGAVRVTACVADGSTCVPKTALTDAAGNYSVTGLHNAAYQLTYTHLAATFQPTTWSTTITSAALAPTRDVVLTAARSITGTVTLGAAGTPAAAGEVRVTARTGEFADYTALTDASGGYVLPNVVDGSYRLRFEYLGSGPFVGEWWPSAPIRETAEYVLVGSAGAVRDEQLADAASISGTVTNAAGLPLNGATVTAVLRVPPGPYDSAWTSPRLVRQTVTTNSSGDYLFPRLSPGEYTVEFYHGTYGHTEEWGADAAHPYAVRFDVAEGEAVTGVDEQFQASTIVLGMAACEICNTIYFTDIYHTWASLEAWDPDAEEWVTVDGQYLWHQSASYIFHASYPGAYRVRARYDFTEQGGDWGYGTSDVVSSNGATYTQLTANVDMQRPVSDRIGGQSRFNVSASISELGFDPGVPVVYIANGLNYPDALSAGPAAAKEGGPLLLVTPDEIPGMIEAEILRLQPQKIVVVGGPASVSPAVYDQLAGMTSEITRLGGLGRYHVSRAVAEYAFGDTGATEAYIATGANFPDALSAGGAAAARDAPVITVDGSAQSIDAATRALLVELGVTTVRIAGGPGSVSPAVMQSIDDIPGISVTRLWGQGRYEASGAINRDTFESTDLMFLAVGTNYPDALSGGALAGATGAPIYVIPSECIPSFVMQDIKSMQPYAVIILGGPGSVSEDVLGYRECSW